MARVERPRRDDFAGAVGRLFDGGSVVGLSESQLLERFARCGDEAAFAAIVDRHGPMVLGICRRVLRDPEDAADAFQAVFLVLARKAVGLRDKELVANWLYGVARRVAVRARADAGRRGGRAAASSAGRIDVDGRRPTAPSPADALARDEEAMRLHEEVERLPARYRAPVVVCYFEGRTHEEAATLLGCPVGTVKGRLARARDLLRRRLERRGVTASAAALATALAAHDLRAEVPPELVAEAVRLALAVSSSPAAWMTAAAVSTPVRHLAQGAVQAMFYSQIKAAAIPAALVATLIIAAGAGLAASGRANPTPDDAVAAAAPAPAAKEDPSPAVARKGAGDPSPEDVLDLIHEASSKYLRSLEDAQLDAADVQGDEPQMLKVLEAHVVRVEKILDEIRSMLIKDADSRALLANFANGVLARERKSLREPGLAAHDVIPILEDAYSKFRRALQRARDEDAAATDAAGKAKALERFLARGSLIANALREKSSAAKEAQPVLMAYADYLSKFSKLDDHAAFHRVVPAAGSSDTAKVEPPPAVVQASPAPAAAPGPKTGEGDRGIGGFGGGGGGFGGGFEGGGMSGPSPEEMRQDIAGLSTAIAKIDGDPRSGTVHEVLARPFSLRSSEDSTLSEMLDQIKSGVKTSEGRKVPIYVDPVGLSDADASLDAKVSIDLEDVPLKTTLRLMLKQLGLAYCVRDGVLIISSLDGVQQELLEAQREMISLDPEKAQALPGGIGTMTRPGGMM